jgi:MEKHLA domain
MQRARASYAGEELRLLDEKPAQQLLDCRLQGLGMELHRASSSPETLSQAGVGTAGRNETIVGDDWIRQTLEMGDRSAHGFIDDYQGVRMANDGTRFRISDAALWWSKARRTGRPRCSGSGRPPEPGPRSPSVLSQA